MTADDVAQREDLDFEPVFFRYSVGYVFRVVVAVAVTYIYYVALFVVAFVELIDEGFERFFAPEHLFDGHEVAFFIYVEHGLDVKYRAQKRRALAEPAAAREIFEVVDHEIVHAAVLDLFRIGEGLFDCRARLALFVDERHEQAFAARIAQRVDDVNFVIELGVELFRDALEVFVRARSGTREAKMKNVLAVLGELGQEFARRFLVDHRRARARAAAHFFVELVEFELVFCALAVFYVIDVVQHVARIDVHFAQQLFGKIACRIGRQDKIHNDTS